ncbi:MAG: TolC family protein [Candidatus Goldbacteria bacterium]|nr:TolC family protein [Candidatus Goldiibacteriota bacterium]
MKRLIALVLSAVFIAGTAAAEPLTFDAALKNAFEKNTSITKAYSDYKISKAVVEQTYGMFDVMLDAGVNYIEQRDIATSPLSPSELKVLSYNVGLSEKIFTGGFLGLKLTNDRTTMLYGDIDPMMAAFLGPAETYDPSLSISLSQPLLKGVWGRPDEKAIEIGKKSILLSKEALKNTVYNQISALRESFYFVYMSDEMLKTQKKLYDDASKFYKETLNLKQIGMRETKDVYQTQASLLSAEAGITPAENQVKFAKEQFLNLAGYSDAQWENIEVEMTGAVEEIEIPGELNSQMEETLVDVQPEVVMAKLGMDMTGIEDEMKFADMLPELNLIGSYGIDGLATDLDGAFDTMSTNNYNNFMVGVNLKYSFPNRGNIAAKSQTEEKLKKAREDYEFLRRQMKIMIRDGYRKLLSAKNDYEKKKEATQLQNKRLGIEEKDFKQGRSSTRELLMAQTDASTAKLSEIGSFITYIQAVNNWSKISGKYNGYFDEYLKDKE